MSLTFLQSCNETREETVNRWRTMSECQILRCLHVVNASKNIFLMSNLPLFKTLYLILKLLEFLTEHEKR